MQQYYKMLLRFSRYSGVARVPCALGRKIYLRPHQQNLQS